MTTKCLILIALASGCVAPEIDDEELDVVEESITCPPGEPYCQPDLVPVYMSAPDGRCNFDGYNLRFGVRNAGAGNARASQVRVSFSASYWPKTYTVPPLVEVEPGHKMACHIPVAELRRLQTAEPVRA